MNTFESNLGKDLYAFLVNHDTSFEIVRYRTQYYRKLIRAMLTVLGVSKTAVEFVDASSYELTPKFTLDSYKLSTMVDQDEVRATGDEYIKSQRLSLLVCPGLPGLGEEYMNADFQFGGEDQVSDVLKLASTVFITPCKS